MEEEEKVDEVENTNDPNELKKQRAQLREFQKLFQAQGKKKKPKPIPPEARNWNTWLDHPKNLLNAIGRWADKDFKGWAKPLFEYLAAKADWWGADWWGNTDNDDNDDKSTAAYIAKCVFILVLTLFIAATLFGSFQVLFTALALLFHQVFFLPTLLPFTLPTALLALLGATLVAIMGMLIFFLITVGPFIMQGLLRAVAGLIIIPCTLVWGICKLCKTAKAKHDKGDDTRIPPTNGTQTQSNELNNNEAGNTEIDINNLNVTTRTPLVVNLSS